MFWTGLKVFLLFGCVESAVHHGGPTLLNEALVAGLSTRIVRDFIDYARSPR
jgi:hypothetical protein